ncbi:conserved hypothetical protein [metagenome]
MIFPIKNYIPHKAFKFRELLQKILEQKALSCPVCQSNKAEIAGEDVKLSGIFQDKEFLTTPLTVLRCTRCGYYMFFDNMAQFTTKEPSDES